MNYISAWPSSGWRPVVAVFFVFFFWVVVLCLKTSPKKIALPKREKKNVARRDKVHKVLNIMALGGFGSSAILVLVLSAVSPVAARCHSHHHREWQLNDRTMCQSSTTNLTLYEVEINSTGEAMKLIQICKFWVHFLRKTRQHSCPLPKSDFMAHWYCSRKTSTKYKEVLVRAADHCQIYTRAKLLYVFHACFGRKSSIWCTRLGWHFLQLFFPMVVQKGKL